jgi:hypothetical protein
MTVMQSDCPPGLNCLTSLMMEQTGGTLARTLAADAQLEQKLAIRLPEGGGAPLAEQILKPALNVCGIRACTSHQP